MEIENQNVDLVPCLTYLFWFPLSYLILSILYIIQLCFCPSLCKTKLCNEFLINPSKRLSSGISESESVRPKMLVTRGLFPIHGRQPSPNGVSYTHSVSCDAGVHIYKWIHPEDPKNAGLNKKYAYNFGDVRCLLKYPKQIKRHQNGKGNFEEILKPTAAA